VRSLWDKGFGGVCKTFSFFVFFLKGFFFFFFFF